MPYIVNYAKIQLKKCILQLNTKAFNLVLNLHQTYGELVAHMMV